MNLLVLWIAGRAIESELGPWRFVVLYLAAGLGGTTLLFVFGPFASAGYGASAAVIGLLAANAIFKHKTREDVRADIGLFVLLILYSILVGFRSFGWLMLIGGIVVGALVGVVLAYAPRQNRSTVQVVGLLGVVLLCLRRCGRPAGVARSSRGRGLRGRSGHPTPTDTSTGTSGDCRVTRPGDGLPPRPLRPAATDRR